MAKVHRMSDPQMICGTCGLVRVVTKSPEATRRWFKKYHSHCPGTPIYRAGVDYSGIAEQLRKQREQA